jgi:hypothetical protein
MTLVGDDPEDLAGRLERVRRALPRDDRPAG